MPDERARVGRAAERVDAAGRAASARRDAGGASERSSHVVALDYGMKWNIPRHLFDQGCQVTILPGTATAEEVLAHKPDGVFLSNGPGDPEPLEYAIGTIRGLLGKKPVFGICLGHQLLSLACGAKTFKLKFGHRGANHPVQRLDDGRGGDHLAEPRLRGRRGDRCPTCARSDAPQPERRHDRRRRATASCRRSACSTTPRRRPGRTTATICSGGFWRRCGLSVTSHSSSPAQVDGARRPSSDCDAMPVTTRTPRPSSLTTTGSSIARYAATCLPWRSTRSKYSSAESLDRLGRLLFLVGHRRIDPAVAAAEERLAADGDHVLGHDLLVVLRRRSR